ncbi:MAG: penicillin-binding protein 2 [Candidatus Pacebacteria bacterium]|nr:penicillin-binding protein 2 [Candidatus Paceibacterota bacterium]
MKGWRSNLVLIFVFITLAAILSRLIYVQIVNRLYWKAMAQGQQNIFEESFGERGTISLSENAFSIAINKNSTFVYASPSEITDCTTTAKNLSEILNIKENLILEKLKKEDTFFVLLKEKLENSEIEKLKELAISGIYLGQERQRSYPQGNFASHILGFVDANSEGQYGLEGYYNDILKGKEKLLQKEKGPLGYFFPDLEAEDNKGANLVLTLDYNIQFMAEKLLKEKKEVFNFSSGQIIVMDPVSGKMIALANFPDFDPNKYSEYANESLEIFQNSATQKVFEPGSTFKPITMAAALEEGKITPQTTYVDEGKLKIGGYIISNYDNRVWGKRTMTEVLEKSINTGAVFAEKLIPHDVFLSYIEKFGFLEKTGIDLPEKYSENKELLKGYEINFATCSFGQGIAMTPIQLCRAFCAIANGGKLVKPYVVDKKVENGTEIVTTPEISEQVISQMTASQVTAMLVSVVDNGYGKAAKIPGYHIAGKTGTAQIPFSALGIDKSGYSDKTVQTFIGYAPAFGPKFLILIKLDNPNTKTAEYSAVPIFQELAKFIINYWQIPPDYNV